MSKYSTAYMLETTCIERPPLCCSYFMFFSLTVMYITPTQPPCIANTKCLLVDKCAASETSMYPGTCNLNFKVKPHRGIYLRT